MHNKRNVSTTGHVSHLLRAPLPQDRHEKYGGDRWRYVVGDLLDVEEELAALESLDRGDPRYADADEGHDEQPGGKESWSRSCNKHQNLFGFGFPGVFLGVKQRLARVDRVTPRKLVV